MKKMIWALIALNILAYFALQAVVYVAPAKAEEKTLPTHEDNKQFIRLHVRANSDTETDQRLKLKVRDGILEYTTALLSGVEEKGEAMALVKENLPGLEEAAKQVVAENGFAYPVRAALKKEYFEYREYDGFYLPADIYDSLIVEIGSGEGHNWWCVIFPAVCLSGSSETSEKETDKSGPVKNGPSGNRSDQTMDAGKISDGADDPFDEASVAASTEPSVRVDEEAVPEKYRLADSPAPPEVKFDFWIVKVFREWFGGKES